MNLFTAGHVGLYPKETREYIVILKREKKSFNVFREKVKIFSESTEDNYGFGRHKQYGNTITCNGYTAVFKGRFLVISGDELLYIHNNGTLWSYRFRLVEQKV